MKRVTLITAVVAMAPILQCCGGDMAKDASAKRPSDADLVEKYSQDDVDAKVQALAQEKVDADSDAEEESINREIAKEVSEIEKNIASLDQQRAKKSRYFRRLDMSQFYKSVTYYMAAQQDGAFPKTLDEIRRNKKISIFRKFKWDGYVYYPDAKLNTKSPLLVEKKLDKAGVRLSLLADGEIKELGN